MRSVPPEIIDTHCHFNHEQLAGDIQELLTGAQETNVAKIIVVGFDLESSREAVRLASLYPQLYAAVGIHPHDAANFNHESMRALVELASNLRVVAIGEIGLDYHYDFASKEDQFRTFNSQIELSNQLGLPIIIHCRKAYKDALDLLKDNYPMSGGVMHCWAGTTEEALRAVELGLHIGFGGLITFKKTDEIQLSAKMVPLDSILLETDAPYMAPAPHRGKRNEPSYTKLVAERLAELRGISVSEIAAATTANAKKLFRRMK